MGGFQSDLKMIQLQKIKIQCVSVSVNLEALNCEKVTECLYNKDIPSILYG